MFARAMISLFILGIASATPKQTGANPFTYPPVGAKIDSSKPVNLTWTPMTTGTITIKLLKGNPTNLADLGAIVGRLDNKGRYEWHVSKDLESSETMPKEHKYGLKIIDDETEGFEYSPAFDLLVPGTMFKAGQTGGQSWKA